MSKLSQKQKLDNIWTNFCDNGKLYKNLTPYEMKMLMQLYYFEELTTFDTAVANVCRSLGFKVELDEQGINYEISV